MNFCCNEFKLQLNWYVLANTTDVVKNFAVIKNFTVKSFHCIENTNPYRTNNYFINIIKK